MSDAKPRRPDPILDAVAALPPRDVDEWRRERIRQRAHEALGASARARGRWSLAYHRVIEPAVVVAVAAVYVVWAVGVVVAIHG